MAYTKLETQVASRFLPQTTYTEFYMMGEVEGLKNYFRLRLDSHAQKEIREVAEAMIKLLENHQPELYSKVI
jgi:thymidylate synthase (FAD)